jgi:NAD(P)H-dependent FMN reductase
LTFRPEETPPKDLVEYGEIIKGADAHLIVSPEYNYSVPPALSNFLYDFEIANY